MHTPLKVHSTNHFWYK